MNSRIADYCVVAFFLHTLFRVVICLLLIDQFLAGLNVDRTTKAIVLILQVMFYFIWSDVIVYLPFFIYIWSTHFNDNNMSDWRTKRELNALSIIGVNDHMFWEIWQFSVRIVSYLVSCLDNAFTDLYSHCHRKNHLAVLHLLYCGVLQSQEVD